MGAHESHRFSEFLDSSTLVDGSAAAGSIGEDLLVHSLSCASNICKTNTEFATEEMSVYAVYRTLSYNPLAGLVKPTALIAINETVP